MNKSNGIISALILAILLAFAFSLGPVSDPVPLTGTSGWVETGKFPPLADKPDPLQVPDSMSGNPSFRMFRTWTPNGVTTGTITSPPFKPAPYMAFPFQRGGQRGYAKPDLLDLRCKASGATWTVSSAETFDEWNVAYVHLPPTFCDGEAVLIGTSNAAHADSYLSVATPFEVSRAAYMLHTSFGARAAVVILAWLAFVLVGLASAIALRPLAALPAAITGVGVSGMAVFTAGLANFQLSTYASVALVALAIGALLSSDRRAVWNELRMPMFVWLAVGMSAFLFVAGVDTGGGRWAANSMFSPLSWSVDNENPVLFAWRYAHAATGDPMTAGPWFFDDRTPLLTVLMIIPQTLFIEPLARLAGSDFSYTADSAVGVLLLALWAPVLLWFSRLIDVRNRLLFIAIVALSPFMLFNTVYTWGKLLGAAYILLAVGLTLMPERRNLGIIPMALTLAYLAHSGNAISAIAFLIVFANMLRWSDLKTLIYGTLAALAVMAPWEYWTQIVQPFGNALTRYQLANDTGFDHRATSVLASTIQNWREIGLHHWLWMKWRSFAIELDVLQRIPLPAPIDNRTLGHLANQRSGDFAVLARTMGIASLGVVLAIFRGTAFQRKLALCGGLAIVAMTLLIIQVGIVHHQAYGSIILLAVAGAMYLADREAAWPKALFGVWLVYFAAAWIVSPLMNADHLHPVTLAMAAAWFGVACIVAVSAIEVPESNPAHPKNSPQTHTITVV